MPISFFSKNSISKPKTCRITLSFKFRTAASMIVPLQVKLEFAASMIGPYDKLEWTHAI